MNIKNDKLTVFLLTFSILVALMLPMSALLPSREEASLYDNIIRLHVLANSDSDEDQALKLKVRDGILETVAGLVEGITDFESARTALADGLAVITESAADVLRREGSDYPVEVTLTREVYPTREYRGVTLPAGEYTSLRVLIGEAEGHNWWCVLFPQLCISVASQTKADSVEVIEEPLIDDSDERLIAAGLTPPQIKLITGDSPDIVIRFRLLEMLESLFR